MASELPPRIDRYRILERLGHGSMGDVYLAVDSKLDRRIALKVMSLHRLGEEDELGELRMRFVQEARAAGRLTHPGIVTVYDADTDEKSGWPFIAMEWVDGPSLRTWLRREGPVPIEHIVTWIAQVARALDYAHGEGVVHRDVKPANLLLNAAGTQAKIADFGVAKLVSNSLTLTGQVLGSPNYMAPEQVKAEDVDGRTDLFGLGVVLYECLTGRTPFASDSLAAITFKIVSVDPRPVEIYNPRVPASLGEIVRRALEKDAADRFQTGLEMAEALESVHREMVSTEDLAHTRELRPPRLVQVPAHRPEPISHRDSPTTLGKRGSSWALAATLLAVIAFFALGYWALGNWVPGTGQELPSLTRPLGVFAQAREEPQDEAVVDDAAGAAENAAGGQESMLQESADSDLRSIGSRNLDQAAPEDTASYESQDTASQDTASQAAASPDTASQDTAPQNTASPEIASPDTAPPDTASHDAARQEVGRDGPTPDPPSPTGQDLESEAAVVTEPPLLTPPPIPKTRLTVAVENKIKLAMISVWVDGDRVLTRTLQTDSWLERRVGQAFIFEVPVPAGEHKVEVHVSGLSSKIEARSSIRGELAAGRSAILDVEINRRRKALSLSWRS